LKRRSSQERREEVQLHLRAQASSFEEAQKRVDALASLLEDEFEDAIFATKGESMNRSSAITGMREKTLAVAESCTAAMLAERITSIPAVRVTSWAAPWFMRIQ